MYIDKMFKELFFLFKIESLQSVLYVHRKMCKTVKLYYINATQLGFAAVFSIVVYLV